MWMVDDGRTEAKFNISYIICANCCTVFIGVLGSWHVLFVYIARHLCFDSVSAPPRLCLLPNVSTCSKFSLGLVCLFILLCLSLIRCAFLRHVSCVPCFPSCLCNCSLFIDYFCLPVFWPQWTFTIITGVIHIIKLLCLFSAHFCHIWR